MIVLSALGSRRAGRVIERNYRFYRRQWLMFASGLLEPVFYLGTVSLGISQLVGDVEGPGGEPLSYVAFVTPALLAVSAMNGAIFDATFAFFFKLNFQKTYDAMLATPVDPADIALGEIAWAQLRSGIYGLGFMVVMVAVGAVLSPWALLAWPASILIGFAFGAVGIALTSFMRTWQDLEYVSLALQPMFLCSTTFFPLSTFPRPLQLLVECTPLYHGVALIRGLTTGVVGLETLGHAGYLLVLGVGGLAVASVRLQRLMVR